MDPLSITASVIAIAELSTKVLTYIHDVAGASEERKKCAQEVTNALCLFNTLQFRVNNANDEDPWLAEVKAMERRGSPLHQYLKALEDLSSKLVPTNNGKSSKLLGPMRRNLQWSFVREDVERTLQTVERLKLIIMFALNNDLLCVHHSNRDIPITDWCSNLTKAIKESTVQLHDAIDEIHTTICHVEQENAIILDNTRHIVSYTTQMAHKNDGDDVLRWLARHATDYESMQIDISQRAQEGTGTWILEDQRFIAWKSRAHGTLFCPGIPGAGKTVLTSIVTENLRRNHEVAATVYFGHKRTEEQSLVKILFSLLLQILIRRSTISGAIHICYQWMQHFTPTLQDALLLFNMALQTLPQTFFLLDALDEITSKQTRAELLSSIRKLQSHHAHLHVMVTARVGTEIDSSFPQEPALEISAASLDIERYVKSNLLGLSLCVQKDKNLQHRISHAIIEAAKGM